MFKTCVRKIVVHLVFEKYWPYEKKCYVQNHFAFWFYNGMGNFGPDLLIGYRDKIFWRKRMFNFIWYQLYISYYTNMNKKSLAKQFLFSILRRYAKSCLNRSTNEKLKIFYIFHCIFIAQKGFSRVAIIAWLISGR